MFVIPVSVSDLHTAMYLLKVENVVTDRSGPLVRSVYKSHISLPPLPFLSIFLPALALKPLCSLLHLLQSYSSICIESSPFSLPPLTLWVSLHLSLSFAISSKALVSRESNQDVQHSASLLNDRTHDLSMNYSAGVLTFLVIWCFVLFCSWDVCEYVYGERGRMPCWTSYIKTKLQAWWSLMAMLKDDHHAHRVFNVFWLLRDPSFYVW